MKVNITKKNLIRMNKTRPTIRRDDAVLGGDASVCDVLRLRWRGVSSLLLLLLSILTTMFRLHSFSSCKMRCCYNQSSKSDTPILFLLINIFFIVIKFWLHSVYRSIEPSIHPSIQSSIDLSIVTLLYSLNAIFLLFDVA